MAIYHSQSHNFRFNVDSTPELFWFSGNRLPVGRARWHSIGAFCFAYPARKLPKAAICSTNAMAISCHTVRDGIHCSFTALRST